MKNRAFDRPTLMRARFMLPCDAIPFLLLRAKREVLKSEFLTAYTSLFWEGRPTGGFMYMEKRIQKAFKSLEAEGSLYFEPRKPLEIIEDLQNETI